MNSKKTPLLVLVELAGDDRRRAAVLVDTALVTTGLDQADADSGMPAGNGDARSCTTMVSRPPMHCANAS